VVLLDGTTEDAQEVRGDIEAFFGKRNIPVTVIATDKKSLNLLGLLRKKVRYPQGVEERREDLFISTVGGLSPFTFASEHETICSPAAFKVARQQIGKEEITDIVILPSEEAAEPSQREVFSTITEYLNIIK